LARSLAALKALIPAEETEGSDNDENLEELEDGILVSDSE